MICLSFDCYLFAVASTWSACISLWDWRLCCCLVRFIFTASFILGLFYRQPSAGPEEKYQERRTTTNRRGKPNYTVQIRLVHLFLFFFGGLQLFLNSSYLCVCFGLLLASGCFGCGPMKSRKHWLGFSTLYTCINTWWRLFIDAPRLDGWRAEGPCRPVCRPTRSCRSVETVHCTFRLSFYVANFSSEWLLSEQQKSCRMNFKSNQTEDDCFKERVSKNIVQTYPNELAIENKSENI